jgi:outer membrane lipopolysaccharide assembly protein LptE/RlpB
MHFKLVKRPFFFAILAAFLTLISACGYHLAGKGSRLPRHIHSIAIPVFENSSSEPGIQRNLTDIIRETYLNDGRLKLKGEKEADLLMKGKITGYELRAVAFDRKDVATEYWVILEGEIDVRDQVKKAAYLREKFSTRRDYKSTANVVDTESAKQAALQEAYRDLARQLVSMVLDRF